jgi:hypothetical protein
MLSKAELLPAAADGPANSARAAANGIPAPARIEMTFANVGETPAFVTGHCLDCVVAGRLPPDPSYRTAVADAVGTMIEPNRTFRITLMPEPPRDQQKNKKTHQMWIYGFISFTDFLDQPHERRFCLRWSRNSGGPTGFVPESDVPPEYVRSY